MFKEFDNNWLCVCVYVHLLAIVDEWLAVERRRGATSKAKLMPFLQPRVDSPRFFSFFSKMWTFMKIRLHSTSVLNALLLFSGEARRPNNPLYASHVCTQYEYT